MKTITISTTYNVKGWINDTHILTECGKVVNVKLGKEIKPVLRGSKKSYWINSEFISDLIVIEKPIECPF